MSRGSLLQYESVTSLPVGEKARSTTGGGVRLRRESNVGREQQSACNIFRMFFSQKNGILLLSRWVSVGVRLLVYLS